MFFVIDVAVESAVAVVVIVVAIDNAVAGVVFVVVVVAVTTVVNLILHGLPGNVSYMGGYIAPLTNSECYRSFRI